MSLIRRSFYRFGDFELHTAQRTLLRAGERIALAPKSFEVLSYLVRRHSEVILKDEIIREVWPDAFVEESNLTQQIFWIRKALGTDASAIVTLPGRGYQFVAPVEEVVVPALGFESGPEPDNTPDSAIPAADIPHTVVAERLQAQMVRSRTRISISEVRPRSILARTGIIAAVAASAGVLIGWGVSSWQHRPIPGDHHSIVLADFDNTTGDPDFTHALKTLLTIDLAQSPFFAISSESDVRKTLKRMDRSPDTQVTLEVGREVCERLNEQAVISGLIARFNQKYLVTLSASDCATGQTLVQTRASASSRDNVIEAVDFAAADLRKRLGDPLRALPSQREKLLPVHTFSLEALQAYSEARALHSRARFKEALPFYQQALHLDPNFAVAYAQIANCYNNLGEADAGQKAMAKAYELRDFAEGSDRLNITSMYEYWKEGDRHKAIQNYENWASLYPNQSNPWVLLGEFRSAVGDLPGAIEAAQHAVAVNPNTVDGRMNLARFELDAGRLDEAKDNARESIARGVDNADVRSVLRDVAFLQHDTRAFDEQIHWFETEAPPDDREDAAAALDLSHGKVQSAVAHWMREADMAAKDGRAESAHQQIAAVAALEAELGLADSVRKRLQAFEPLPTLNLPASAAVIMAAAEAGNTGLADKDFTIMRDRNPHDSDVREFWSPEIASTLALARKEPQQAIAALAPALPYEPSFADVTALRARAYLAAGEVQPAEEAFRHLIDHPFLSVISENTALAHLGLARALKLEGNLTAARSEYDTFFTLWKEADATLPVVRDAHREYASLNH